MSKFVKDNLIKLVLIGLLAIWVGLNCLGFCFDKKRVLSDDEKIRIVVADILANYPKVVEGQWSIPPGESDGSTNWEKKFLPARPIPYLDMDEFFSLNPDCCYVTQHYQSIYVSEGGDVGGCGWFGGKSAVVVVHYLFRYQDEKGEMRTELLEHYPAMNNCGKFIYDF